MKPCTFLNWISQWHVWCRDWFREEYTSSWHEGIKQHKHIQFSICKPSLSVHSSPPASGICSAAKCWLCGGSPATAGRTTHWRPPPQSTTCGALEEEKRIVTRVKTSWYFRRVVHTCFKLFSSIVRPLPTQEVSKHAPSLERPIRVLVKESPAGDGTRILTMSKACTIIKKGFHIIWISAYQRNVRSPGQLQACTGLYFRTQ